MQILNAFKSRKFTAAITGALLIGLNDALKLGLDEGAQTKIVALLVAWILGESAIDAAGAVASKKDAPAQP